VWTSVVTVSSNFSRKHALYIGMAASMQLITTRVSSGVYRGAWNATPKGLSWLNETEEDQ
jgi:hypothetical protein